MELFEKFKEKVREKNPGKIIGSLRRHLMPWYSSHSIVGKASRFSAFLDNWVGQAKEDASHIMESDVTEGYYTLNSHDIAKSRSDGEKYSMVVSAIRILGEGSLLDTKEVYERWSATPNTYSIYRYDLSDTLHCLLVQKTTAYDPPRWLPYIFSSVESEQEFQSGFRQWFWQECSGAAYFVALQEGAGHILAPEKQGQYGDTKHIGEGGPDELFTYWRDFSSNDFPLSLLLIGGPGTGKSSSVRQMAKDNNLFFARIDPQLLQTSLMNEHVFTIWLDVFRPDILLLDDIHGIRVDAGLSIVLSMLEHINKTSGPDVLVVGTANQLDQVDQALRRPGRFDMAIAYSSEGYEEEIMDHYAEIHNCRHLIESHREHLVKQFKNLTPAYIEMVVKMVSAFRNRDRDWLWSFIDKRLELMVKLADPGVNTDELVSPKAKRNAVGFGVPSVNKTLVTRPS